MKHTIQNSYRTLPALAVIAVIIFGCSKITDMMQATDRLYFCERYVSSTDKCEGESTKYTTGTLTVMAKLKESIGVTNVNINITDKGTGKVVNTLPFTVSSHEDYIYFDDVPFDSPGNYRVSLLKEDGTVVVSNEIEIISK